jgi:hypothetical protein
MIWEVHRESGFFSIPDPGVKKAPDPDPQHWSLELNCMLTKQKSLENRQRGGTDEIHGWVGLVVGHARQGHVQGRLAVALWNRNYFFRFRLLKSYGSGSNF